MFGIVYFLGVWFCFVFGLDCVWKQILWKKIFLNCPLKTFSFLHCIIMNPSSHCFSSFLQSIFFHCIHWQGISYICCPFTNNYFLWLFLHLASTNQSEGHRKKPFLLKVYTVLKKLLKIFPFLNLNLCFMIFCCKFSIS